MHQVLFLLFYFTPVCILVLYWTQLSLVIHSILLDTDSKRAATLAIALGINDVL